MQYDLYVTIERLENFSTTMIKSNRPESFTVDWGDGHVEEFKDVSGEVPLNHTYDKFGTYTIGFDFGNITLADKYELSYPFIDFSGLKVTGLNGSLPFMKLTERCYNRMFEFCKIENLSNFSLPATQLTRDCYEGMFFKNNIKFLNGFSLPAKKLERGCYFAMFMGNQIINLKGFDLGAVTLERDSMTQMFADNHIDNDGVREFRKILKFDLNKYREQPRKYFDFIFDGNNTVLPGSKEIVQPWYEDIDEKLTETKVMSFGQFLNESKMNENFTNPNDLAKFWGENSLQLSNRDEVMKLLNELAHGFIDLSKKFKNVGGDINYQEYSMVGSFGSGSTVIGVVIDEFDNNTMPVIKLYHIVVDPDKAKYVIDELKSSPSISWEESCKYLNRFREELSYYYDVLNFKTNKLGVKRAFKAINDYIDSPLGL